MATFNNLITTGSLELSSTTENTSSAGYLWFDGTDFKYSKDVSGTIVACTL